MAAIAEPVVAGPGQPAAPTAPTELLVDPSVSRAKFDRELAEYRRLEREYVKRGWLLVRAEYPEVIVLLAAPHLTPRAVLLGAVLDFTNYDLWPPSVKFVDPFTLEPLRGDQLPFRMLKQQAGPPAAAGKLRLQLPAGPAGQVQMIEVPVQGMMRPPQPLIMWHDDQLPFLCVAGVREYHNHAFHSNNPWLAHRGTTVGRLYHLLDVIWRYGIQPLKGFEVNIKGIEIGRPIQDPTEVPE